MIIAATGHRPDKLGGYGPSAFSNLVDLARQYLIAQKPEGVIVGMALGWDLAFAQGAVGLGIPVHGAVPFKGQASKWPEYQQDIYQRLVSQCASVTVVSEGGFSAEAMQARNRWMVDRAHRICALYSGEAGGTRNCVKYAEQLQRPIDNLWGQFARGVQL